MSVDNPTPTLGPILRRNGVAGQISYNVTVTYPDEPPRDVTFVGSVYDGPVVMVMPSGVQVFVVNPGRHGAFNAYGARWVYRFFANRSES
jgi:hypothetical protein